MNDTPKLFKFTFYEDGQCYVRIDTNKNVYSKDFELAFDMGEHLGHLLSFICPVILIDETGYEVVYYNGEEIMNEDMIDEIKNPDKKEIKEIKEKIKEFADAGQYSVNNPYVKSLFRRLRELEGREQIEEEDYTPRFIGDSDVPINGYYE